MDGGPEARYAKIVNVRCLGNRVSSAFSATVMAALFAPFLGGVAFGAGLSETTATACWAYTTALAMLLMALSAPCWQ